MAIQSSMPSVAEKLKSGYALLHQILNSRHIVYVNVGLLVIALALIAGFVCALGYHVYHLSWK